MKIIKIVLCCLFLLVGLLVLVSIVVNFDVEVFVDFVNVVDVLMLVFVGGFVKIYDIGIVYLVVSVIVFFGMGFGNFYGVVGDFLDKMLNKGVLVIIVDFFCVDVSGGFNGLFSVDFVG